jgi:hypothetical protein
MKPVRKKKVIRPERVVETNGVRTYDSHLCCWHAWTESSSERRNNVTFVKQFCQICGATSVTEDGRIVEYDAVADFLKKLSEEERRAATEQP